MKKMKSYRLSTETLELIEMLGKEFEADNTTIVEQCIHFTAMTVMPDRFVKYSMDNNFLMAIPKEKVKVN